MSSFISLYLSVQEKIGRDVCGLILNGKNWNIQSGFGIIPNSSRENNRGQATPESELLGAATRELKFIFSQRTHLGPRIFIPHLSRHLYANPTRPTRLDLPLPIRFPINNSFFPHFRLLNMSRPRMLIQLLSNPAQQLHVRVIFFCHFILLLSIFKYMIYLFYKQSSI